MKKYKCTGTPRSFLYKPNSNTVMAAIFNSPQSTQKLIQVIRKLIDIHPLLSVSLQIDESGDVWLSETDDVAYEITAPVKKEEDLIQDCLRSPINPLKDRL